VRLSQTVANREWMEEGRPGWRHRFRGQRSTNRQFGAMASWLIGR